MKKGQIQGSICFKLVLGLLVLGPLSKVALKHEYFVISKDDVISYEDGLKRVSFKHNNVGCFQIVIGKYIIFVKK
jgi:hypothetical protein